MLITVLPNPSWQLSLAQLNPSLFFSFFYQCTISQLPKHLEQKFYTVSNSTAHTAEDFLTVFIKQGDEQKLLFSMFLQFYWLLLFLGQTDRLAILKKYVPEIFYLHKGYLPYWKLQNFGI